MNKNEFEIYLDIKNINHIEKPIVRQNDDIIFNVNVLDGGVPFDLTYVTSITIATERSDEVVVVSPSRSQLNNQVRFQLPRSAVSIVGKNKAAVQMFGDGRVSTLNFDFEVIKDPAGSNWTLEDGEATLIEIVLGEGPKVIQDAKDATQEALNVTEEVGGTLSEMKELRDETEEVRDSTQAVKEEAEEFLGEARENVSEAVQEAYDAADKAEQERLDTKAEREATEAVRGDTEALKESVEDLRDATQSVKESTEQERLDTKEEREATESIRQSVEELKEETEEVRDSTLEAKESAEDATEVALESASDAEDAAGYANTQGERAENAADAAASAMADATEAAEYANTQGERAENATEEADVQSSRAEEAAEYAKTQGERAENAAEYANEQGERADEFADYANVQGKRAEDAADLIDEILEEGNVASVNGKTGAVTLDAEDVGAETPQGAQEKADEALGVAKDYVDSQIAEIPEPDLSEFVTEEVFDAHTEARVFQGEVHGMRLTDGTFEVFDGTEWVEIKGGGGGSVPLGNVENLSADAEVGLKAVIKWRDPSDVVLEGITLAKWGGTMLRRKEGTYPVDEKDGELVVESNSRDEFENSGYIDEDLSDGVTYYYALFPYTDGDLFTIDSANRASVTAFEKHEQSPPSKPVASNMAQNKVTITSDEGAVVSLDESTWFASPHEFTELTEGDTYTPYAKFEETDTHWESSIVAGDSFEAVNKLPQDEPSNVSVGSISHDKATVTSDSGAVVSINGTDWFSSPHEFTGLSAETDYTAYAKFEETDTHIESNVVEKSFETGAEHVNYGVRIDTTNPDPSGAVTYIADAEGFSPLSVDGDNTDYGSWEDTFLIRDIKVAIIKNGEINYELDRNDYSKKKDGGNADITSGNDGDVMVGFPLAYWKFETVGDNLDIYIADAQIDSGYIAGAHSRNGVVQDDFVWISAYKASESGSKLRSLSSKTAADNKTIGAFRTLAQANGDGYEQFTYYQMLLLQIMTLVTTKSRDSQSALGMGYTNGNTGFAPTGTTDKKGLFYGESGGKQQMKAFGIEDFYGNKYDWVDGLVTDGSYDLLIGDSSFNDGGSGYDEHSTDITSNSGGYVSKVQGGTQSGFVGAEFSGSTTTHYADYGFVVASRVAGFGGYLSMGGSGAFAGAFFVQLYNSASSSYAFFGARCSFLKT